MSQRVLIVDDERLARLRIRNYLAKNHADFDVREAADGYEALEAIPQFQPELVFLDVEMPELSGFDVLNQLESPFFQVIFETAYDQFALKAFNVNACDYLLKPFSDERLGEAVRRALRRDAGEYQLQRLQSHLREQGRYLERLVVKLGLRSKLIEASEINYILSEDHRTQIFLNSVSYDYDNSLNFLEEKLNPKHFVRVHRNAIVSVNAVSSFTPKTKMSLVMKDRKELKVSRNRVDACRAALES
jgi:two-component system LytT family response regulator